MKHVDIWGFTDDISTDILGYVRTGHGNYMDIKICRCSKMGFEHVW